MSLGTEMRIARIRKGWKQKDVIARSGLSPKTVSDVEYDRVDPRWSTVLKLAKLLDVSVGALAEATTPS